MNGLEFIREAHVVNEWARIYFEWAVGLIESRGRYLLLDSGATRLASLRTRRPDRAINLSNWLFSKKKKLV
jgi:hypothetical protein